MNESEKTFLLSLFDFDNKLSDSFKIKKLYSLSNNVEKKYKKYEIKKRNGKVRVVYEPNYYLKNIQRNILKKVLYDKIPSSNATAYCVGKSIKDNAIPHTNKNIILKLDIKSFFDNISFSNVYEVFSSYGFSKGICGLLTYLTTYNDMLPQGAPTSSYLSNLILRDFDFLVDDWCKERNIDYTRYSDDMTFSMDKYNKDIIPFIRKNLYKYGLELNNEKIHVIRYSNKQKITGVVVNKKINADIVYRKKIRQEIYYIKKYGLGSHLNKINYKEDNKKYLLLLLGRINFVLSLEETKEFKEYSKYIKKLINLNIARK